MTQTEIIRYTAVGAFLGLCALAGYLAAGLLYLPVPL